MSPKTRITGESADEIRHLAPDVETLALRLAEVDYLLDEGLAAAIFLSLRLPLPLLLEGEAGVGNTHLAKALAEVLETPLIRLQCYEEGDHELFGPDYLIRRPLLRALEHPGPRPAVLLIDEIDRADSDFEAFLLELLAESAVTIPELGTIRATHPPIVLLTSNRTRDLHDAIKRRCLYHQWTEYPDVRREFDILRRRVRGTAPGLTAAVANAIALMRQVDVIKPPGVAEAIDWLAALQLLEIEELDAAAIERTLGSVLKYTEDHEAVRAPGLDELLAAKA